MKAWEEYAFVLDGTVQNIAVFAVGGYTDANITAREVYGESCIAVNVSQIPTAIGDTYHDGIFWRVNAEGKETAVQEIPTEEESVNELNKTTGRLQTETDANAAAIDDILVAMLNEEA